MDNVTRLIGHRLTATWRQQIVVDDRPGAGGIIGHELAAKAAPDGYTLLLSASSGVVRGKQVTALSAEPFATQMPRLRNCGPADAKSAGR